VQQKIEIDCSDAGYQGREYLAAAHYFLACRNCIPVMAAPIGCGLLDFSAILRWQGAGREVLQHAGAALFFRAAGHKISQIKFF
jgi:hypothetical protein